MNKSFHVYLFFLTLALLTMLSCNSRYLLKTSLATYSDNCPDSVVCPGTCDFEIGLIGTKDIKACNGQGGYISALLKLGQSSTGENCFADFEREPVSDEGKGLITWTLCNGTVCKLSQKNFVENNPKPLRPDDEIPDGKEALSAACYSSIQVVFDSENRSGATYNFLGEIKSVSSDFTILASCDCIEPLTNTPPKKLGVIFSLD